MCAFSEFIHKNMQIGNNHYLKIRQIIIQTSRQRSAPYTNLHELTKRCYWLDSKIFSQPVFRNLSTSIKYPIGFIQIQTGSLVLFFLQVSLPLLLTHKVKFLFYILYQIREREVCLGMYRLKRGCKKGWGSRVKVRNKNESYDYIGID